MSTHKRRRLSRRRLLGATTIGEAATGTAVAGDTGLRSTASAAGLGHSDDGRNLVVDTGAGLVFKVSNTTGDLTSLRYRGKEYEGYGGRHSHVESGLGSATVTLRQSGRTIRVKAAHGAITQWYAARSGQSAIHLAAPSTARCCVTPTTRAPGSTRSCTTTRPRFTKSRYGGAVPAMGQHLRTRFGDAYYALGLLFGSGSFRARRMRPGPWSRPGTGARVDNRIGPARPDTVEARLAIASPGDHLVDLRSAANAPTAVREWLNGRHHTRSFGAAVARWTYRFNLSPLSPAEEYDGLAYVAVSTGSQPLPTS